MINSHRVQIAVNRIRKSWGNRIKNPNNALQTRMECGRVHPISHTNDVISVIIMESAFKGVKPYICNIYRELRNFIDSLCSSADVTRTPNKL